jgi:2-(1,2-epoxy-1,2-dihydrophenyl)acetyl-CoA isomerase
MQHITVSVPDDVYRLTKIRAAEQGRSVNSLVAEFLRAEADAEFARLEELQRQVQAEIAQFRASDRLDRNQVRPRPRLAVLASAALSGAPRSHQPPEVSMAAYETIEVEQQGRVRIIRFNRPEKLNANNATLSAEFEEAIEEANADPDVGAIVSTGNGRAYCSGADLSGDRQPGREPRAPGRPFYELAAESKPIIGAINGAAVGVGITRALFFDTLIASTEARFSFRFAAIGFVPELGSTWMLPKIVGLHRAREMMLTGRIYSAQEVLQMGLVYRVVEPDRLIAEALALGEEIAANPPSTVRQIKQTMWADLITHDGFDDVWTRSNEAFRESTRSLEAREAIAAFREKRKPRFHDAEYMRQLAEQPRA